MSSLRTDDGRTLSWREIGTGPELLCHPGGPGASSPYFGELPQLAARRKLILIDPRGTGGSDRPADRSAYGLDDYAGDIEALRRRLGLERVDLLGHSHGGFVAMAWAGAHPERVDRLVLASTAPRFTDAIRERRMERAAEHHGQLYFEDAMTALAQQQAGGYETDDELIALYMRASPLFTPLGEDGSAIEQALRASGINADAVRHFNEAVAPAMELRAALARVRAPVLVVAGDRDAFGGPTQRELAGALPNAELVTLAGADHFPFHEPRHAQDFARAVLDFLSR